jgi:TIR domain
VDVCSGERDFFISYHSADQPYAEWIAWELEDAGYTTFVQAWDIRPGQNFVHQMQQGASSCPRTIAVLTPAYFESGFTRAEWYNAFAKDPTGEAGLLLPVRVAECDVEGLLGQIIYIDLVGLEKTQARERLLAGIEGTRAKPAQPPEFPRLFPVDRNIRVVPPLPPPSAEDRRGLLILLDRVKRFWVEGVSSRPAGRRLACRTVGLDRGGRIAPEPRLFRMGLSRAAVAAANGPGGAACRPADRHRAARLP